MQSATPFATEIHHTIVNITYDSFVCPEPALTQYCLHASVRQIYHIQLCFLGKGLNVNASPNITMYCNLLCTSGLHKTLTLEDFQLVCRNRCSAHIVISCTMSTLADWPATRPAKVVSKDCESGTPLICLGAAGGSYQTSTAHGEGPNCLRVPLPTAAGEDDGPLWILLEQLHPTQKLAGLSARWQDMVWQSQHHQTACIVLESLETC